MAAGGTSGVALDVAVGCAVTVGEGGAVKVALGVPVGGTGVALADGVWLASVKVLVTVAGCAVGGKTGCGTLCAQPASTIKAVQSPML